ncbi:MAG: hypothetical protein LBR87_07615 [Synergistaceae bacterium]|jgi:beta-RFAP synthase|nr:hypothetical protein [Synergistaceae bacterium]
MTYSGLYGPASNEGAEFPGAPDTVEITSAARLHFGFLDAAGSLGRKFGSIGLAISYPRIRLRARLSDDIPVRCSCGENTATALRYSSMFYEYMKSEGADLRSGAEITLDEIIPPHAGLGSGTQTALCVVSSLFKLHGMETSARGAAVISRRGLRSGVGIESFARGGFIVDAGSPDDMPPQTVFRGNFPKDWKVVLVFPPDQGEGLSGEKETTAFGSFGNSADPAPAREICHILMMKLLPSIMEKKLGDFGAALERIQEITGDSFAGFQSGRYASPMAEDIFRVMRRLGAAGMGQSSWGPVLYGFAGGDLEASRIASGVREFFQGASGGAGSLEVSVVSGRNHGAEITARREGLDKDRR